MAGTPDSLTWKMKRQLEQFFFESIQDHPNWPIVISEGDSWFSFPIHANTIDDLDEMAQHKMSLLRLEQSGDKALRIIGGSQKAKLADLLKRYKVNALLFSGGGNDVVGEDLLPLLNQWQAGMTWQQCINETTTKARFDRLQSAYLDLVHLRNENRPNCLIYIHGYDWAIPSGQGATMWGIKVGPWMKQYLVQKGINDAADQKAIIHELLRRFNAMLDGIAINPKVVRVQTLGTLAENEWNDELHPSREGFQKIAGKFREKLHEQFPDTF
jgi:lysophospholipase L1-like esterase